MFQNVFKSAIVGGYKKENVLQYIEKLTIDIEAQTAELEREKQALSKFAVETELNASKKLEEITRRSQEITARAELESERLIRQAQDHAKQALEQAQLQANQILAQSQLKATQTAEAAEAQKSEILKSCDHAKKFLFQVYGMYHEVIDDSIKLLMEKEEKNGRNCN